LHVHFNIIMETTTNPIKVKYKFAADYGLILGGYIALFYCIQLAFGNNMMMGLVNMAGFFGTPFVCYYLVKRYRDTACKGYIDYAQAWSFGVWLFLFAGLIMSVVYFVHMQWIDPNFLEKTLNQTLVTLEQMKYDQKIIDTLAATDFPSPIQVVLVYLFMYIIGGALLFLALAAFVVKKNPNDLLGKGSTNTPYKPYQDNNPSDTNA